MGGQSASAVAGEATITPVFWAPAGYTFPTAYRNIITQYIADVAHDSSTNSNVFGVATQYYQKLGASAQENISYVVHAGTAIDATESYPSTVGAAACTPSAGQTACVTNAALATEVQTLITSRSLTKNDSHLYMVFFPPAVDSCFNPGAASGSNPCSSNAFCGYHSAFGTVSAPAIYSSEPYPPLNGCADPFNGPQAPNGNPYADAALSVVSHEASESITDWDGAWYDSNGYENGDECAYTYGTALGSSGVSTDAGATGTMYNQLINGHKYYTQDEFSNADLALGRGDVNTPAIVGDSFTGVQVLGCLQRPTPVGDVTLNSSANPAVVQQSLTLTAQVTGPAGAPVPTGTVNFVDNGTSLGSTSLTAGSATLTLSTLTAGAHSVVAQYSGNAVLAAANSPALTQQINFTDVPTGAPFAADIYWLTNSHVASGFADGSFHPTDAVTRQAFAAYMYRYTHGADAGTCTSGTSPFSDVPDASQFCGDIKWLSTSGITGGFADGTFHPTATVTRQAAAAFFYRLQFSGSDAGVCPGSSPYPDVPATSGFCGDIAWLASTTPQAITTGFADGGFHPAAAVTRQAVAAYFHRYDTDFGSPV
jgi:hypothetical protein